MPTVDPNSVMLTGENPFIRLSTTDGSPNTTEASFWRIIFSFHRVVQDTCSILRANPPRVNCASIPTILL
jgi:hypothetical protein